MKFSDEINIYISSGKGGDGLFSFSNKKTPNGGNGGKGGDVLLICDKNIITFQHLDYMTNYKAEDGKNGKKNNKTGKSGKNLIIKTPPGTIIYDGEKNIYLGKLEKNGEKIILAKGGRMGYGNFNLKNDYKKFNKLKTGGNCTIKLIHLELNLIADAGLLGLPNAGKSSFINFTTNVSSKIGEYKFTTINPVIGYFKKISEKIILADMPGLISLSSSGKGLGFNFLKHLSKTKLLLHFIDLSKINNRYIFIKNMYTINNELKKFEISFIKKKRWIILTKSDLVRNFDFLNNFFLKNCFVVFVISVKNFNGIKKLIFNINEYFNKI